MQGLRNSSIVICVLFISVFILFTAANVFSDYADDSSLLQSLLYGILGITYFTVILVILYRDRNPRNKLVTWLSFIFSLLPLLFLIVVFLFSSLPKKVLEKSSKTLENTAF